MSRTLYLICYDIRLSQRRHKVCRYLQGYKVEGQKSVFECWLTESDYREVLKTLGRVHTNTKKRYAS